MKANAKKQQTPKGKETSNTRNRKPTKKQEIIIRTKQEHPDLSTRDIAAVCETDHSHVSRTLATYKIVHGEVTRFIENRAQIFAGLQHRLLASITDADIEKAPMGSRVLAAAQIYDKERIERGLSGDDSRPLVLVIRGDNAQVMVGSPPRIVDNPVDK
jgi:hypothetical protein